ncbi:calcium:proton antiporter [Flavobacterium nackdongense]|uniref:Ionic transporter y4hA n=1 Tax=Flavobacterium nackdongense TaxID=2547394 RepID=A0A4V1AGD7_9FLAO|nr:ionic transporter y4hA [Flavobacterium nackdongense]QBN17682.1 ionic transporter y4hA [Flavobacterium nackdongense]
MKSKNVSYIPIWSIVVPIISGIIYAGAGHDFGGFYLFVLTLSLIFSVLIAVHHAEVVAVRIGEPLGTLVLAVAVTTIEVALIISLMLVGGDDTAYLARDTVFAAEMIIINGIVGACLLLGGMKFSEQVFGLEGVSAALTVLIAILVLTLILPNYTTSTIGPSYSGSQLIFVGIISLILYGTFLIMQTVKHRDYFLQVDNDVKEDNYVVLPTNKDTFVSAIGLIFSLILVVLLAKKLAPSMEEGIASVGAPKSLAGIIIAMVVLLPEAISALKAASKNRLQSSLNLALGSALASIGLTIPAVAFVALYFDLPLTLGIDTKSTVLFFLSLFIVSLSLRTGRTTMIQGVVLLVIFVVYLFITIVP